MALRKSFCVGLLALFACLFPVAHAQKKVALTAVTGAVSAVLPEGRFEVFVGVNGKDGGVWHNWESEGGTGQWQPTWTHYGTNVDNTPSPLAAHRDGAGRLVVAWIDGGVIHAEAALVADSGLSPLPVISPSKDADGKIYKFNALTVATDAAGFVEILALNERGRVFSLREASLQPGQWSWQQGNAVLIGGGDVQQIDETTFGSALAVAGVGKDGQVYVKLQSSPGVWEQEPWIPLQGTKIKSVRVRESLNHQLEIAALGSDGNFYLVYQREGSTNWVPWSALTDVDSTPFGGKLGPSFFFDQFKSQDLFLVYHTTLAIDSGFGGIFGMKHQFPNNGGWQQTPGVQFTAETEYAAGTDPNDNLSYLSKVAFDETVSSTGQVHFFAAIYQLGWVWHLSFLNPEMRKDGMLGGPDILPALPWKYDQE